MTKAKQLAEKLKQYIPNGDGYNSEFANDLAEVIEYLNRDEQEPVAWRVYYEPKQQYTIFQHYPGILEHLDIQPLYTDPPKRQSLSDEEIDWLSRGNKHPASWQKIKEFARAIEKAHGIWE